MVAGHQTCTLAIHLEGPPPAQQLRIAIENSLGLDLKPVATAIPAGANYKEVSISCPHEVTVPSLDARVSASIGALKAPRILHLTPPRLYMYHATVSAGDSFALTIIRQFPAMVGGVDVYLNGPESLHLPEKIHFNQGVEKQVLNVDTPESVSDSIAKITATSNGVSATGNVTIKAQYLRSLSLSSNLRGSQPLTISFALTAPSPSGGLVINLNCSSPLVAVPATFTIPAGQTAADLTVNTLPTYENNKVHYWIHANVTGQAVKSQSGILSPRTIYCNSSSQEPNYAGNPVPIIFTTNGLGAGETIRLRYPHPTELSGPSSFVFPVGAKAVQISMQSYPISLASRDSPFYYYPFPGSSNEVRHVVHLVRKP